MNKKLLNEQLANSENILEVLYCDKGKDYERGGGLSPYVTGPIKIYFKSLRNGNYCRIRMG